MADQNQMHSEDKSGEAITDTKSLAAALDPASERRGPRWSSEHMYSVTRPVRLAMVALLPYFKIVSVDFLHHDCL